MCRGHVVAGVAPASSMAVPAASRHGAVPRQDAGFVLVLCLCRCQAFVLLYFATERGARVKIPLRQEAGCGRSHICGFETHGNSAVRMRGSRAHVLTTLSKVSVFPELSPLALSPCVTHIRAQRQCFRCRHFFHPSSHAHVPCLHFLTARAARVA